MARRHLQPNRQKGMALLAALILIMALVLILGNIFYRHQIDVSRLTQMLHKDQAVLMALSVESWAGQLLSSERDDRTIDSLDENWAMAVPLLPVDGGFIRGCVIDLQSRINLNSFSAYDSQGWIDEMDDPNETNGLVHTWLSLLEAASLPASPALAVAIIDWVDADTVTLNEMGAEQLNYDAARSPVIVPNSLLSDVAELSVIRDYDLSIVQVLEPILSALPRATPININTAHEDLLIAMGGKYSRSFSEFVLQSRPFNSLNEFQQALKDYLALSLSEVRTLWPAGLVSVNSDYFQLEVQVTLGEATIEIHSIMDRFNRDKAIVISRTVSVIPAILSDASFAGNANNEPVGPGFCENSGLIRS